MSTVTKIKAEYYKVDRSDHTNGPFLLRAISQRFRPEDLHTIKITASSTLETLPRKYPADPVSEKNMGKLKWKIRLSDTDFHRFASLWGSLSHNELEIGRPSGESDETSGCLSGLMCLRSSCPGCVSQGSERQRWEETAVQRSKSHVEWLNKLLQNKQIMNDPTMLSFIEVGRAHELLFHVIRVQYCIIAQYCATVHSLVDLSCLIEIRGVLIRRAENWAECGWCRFTGKYSPALTRSSRERNTQRRSQRKIRHHWMKRGVSTTASLQ